MKCQHEEVYPPSLTPAGHDKTQTADRTDRHIYLSPIYLLYPNPWNGQEMQCPQLGFFLSNALFSTTT